MHTRVGPRLRTSPAGQRTKKGEGDGATECGCIGEIVEGTTDGLAYRRISSGVARLRLAAEGGEEAKNDE